MCTSSINTKGEENMQPGLLVITAKCSAVMLGNLYTRRTLLLGELHLESWTKLLLENVHTVWLTCAAAPYVPVAAIL